MKAGLLKEHYALIEDDRPGEQGAEKVGLCNLTGCGIYVCKRIYFIIYQTFIILEDEKFIYFHEPSVDNRCYPGAAFCAKVVLYEYNQHHTEIIERLW